MKSIFTFLFLLFITISASAQNLYVSGSGNDSNDGRSEKTSFRTLQKAANLVQPGDVVWIGDGIYTGTKDVVNIERSGRADAWITWKALPGSKPEVRPSSWGGIEIQGSYHILDGITVIGRNDSITLLSALAEAKNKQADGAYNTNGIFVNGRLKKPNEKPHHVIIRNCVVGKCPGGGITLIETDYVTIEDCKVFNNAWFMRYGGSGITTLNNWAYDDAPGYHIVIQRNYVWNNKTMVPWDRIQKLSDGNGILLDVTDQNRNGATNPNADAVVNPAGDQPATSTTPARRERPKRPEWKGRALIANNVSAFNGGSGIHTFRTKHVDIINNTTYWNGQIVGYQELFPNNSEDIVILNNIMVPKPGGKVTSNNKNTNIRWDYNLYPLSQNDIKGPNDIIADPQFINIQLDLMQADFRTDKKSQARDSGTSDVSQATDINGKKRPNGKGRDRGAFEQ